MDHDQLNFFTYQLLAQEKSDLIWQDGKVDKGCANLCIAAGKCLEMITKHKYQGLDLDKSALIHELGNTLLSVAEISSGLGINLSVVAAMSIK